MISDVGDAVLDSLQLEISLPNVNEGSPDKSLIISVPVWDTKYQEKTLSVVDSIVAALKREGIPVKMKTSHKISSTVEM